MSHQLGRRTWWWTLFSALTLGGLLAYLVIRQALEPNVTDYWWYMTVQIALTLIAVLALDVYFRREGGLSWHTHLVVSAKHVGGHARHRGAPLRAQCALRQDHASLRRVAITAAAADRLRCLNDRGVISSTLGWRLVAAVTITLLLNVGWETYEYLGDVVLHSTRHQGVLDTTYDFVSDLARAMVAALAIVRTAPGSLDVDRRVAVEVTRA